MKSWLIGAYFGIGVFLTQAFHTAHAASNYGQKEVRWLEWIPGFSRRDPDDPELVRPPFPPWKLPYLQMDPRCVPWYAKVMGLHATNLFYCYVMSAVYGVLATVVVRYWVPSLTEVTLPALVQFASVFAALHVFSFAFVGSGVTNTLLEGNLAFNVLVLALLSTSLLSYGEAIGVLQFGAALTVGPLVFWLHFQYDQGHIDYGNFIPMYYVIVPVLYSEFLVLTLGLL